GGWPQRPGHGERYGNGAGGRRDVHGDLDGPGGRGVTVFVVVVAGPGELHQVGPAGSHRSGVDQAEPVGVDHRVGGGAEEVELDLLAEVEVRNEVGGEPLVADTNDGPHHLAGDDAERVQVVIQRRLKHHPIGDGGVSVLDIAPHDASRRPVVAPDDGVEGV